MSTTLLAYFSPQRTHTPPPATHLLSTAWLRAPQPSLFCPRPRTVRSALSRRRRVLLLVAASSSSFDELHARGKPRRNLPKSSLFSNLIQEIEPLDVSIIQKDVPVNTIDAMKRTISSMLGLLPSDQFQVSVEAFWDPLSKLLISSMMTGYTLRNAEYRLCLERNLDVYEQTKVSHKSENMGNDDHKWSLGSTLKLPDNAEGNGLPLHFEENTLELSCGGIEAQGLGEVTPEVKKYIDHLQSRLSSIEKELGEVKRKNSALEMQHFVGEEKNDLLDYLRSLQPEKVAELSEPSHPEVQEAVHSVVHGLLATLSPKILSKMPPLSENAASGTLNDVKDDCTELVENSSLHFQPLISVSRDYLARLLFWCMLLGHHLRGLEYRLELIQLLTLSSNVESVAPNSDQVV